MYSVYHSLSNSKQKVSPILSLIVGKAMLCECFLHTGSWNVAHLAFTFPILFSESLCPVPWLSIIQVLQRLGYCLVKASGLQYFQLLGFHFLLL